MPIFFIHGRAQENQDAQALHQKWRNTLATRGFDRAGLTLPQTTASFFPYYGDALVAHVDRATQSDPESAFRSGRMDAKQAGIFGELAREYGSLALVRAKASGMEVEGRHPRSGPAAAGGAAEAETNVEDRMRGSIDVDGAVRGLNSFLRVVDQVVPSVSALAIDILRDVSVYLADARARSEVLDIVGEQFKACERRARDTGEPIVVVGHSLGTVVGHDFFSTRTRSSIDLFVTIGSPLAVSAIKRRLLGERLWPAGVRSWVNASDPRDVVAIVPALGRFGFFEKDYTSNVDSRCDVLNLVDIDNRTDNRHGITGYLDDPGVARCIAAALGLGKPA